MAIGETIRNRRTIKAFKPDPIPEAEWTAWLEAASHAPNHRMTEPWEVLVVGPNARAELNHKTDFGQAPLVLAILSKPAPTPLDRDENLMASACFAQNFQLAAHEAGAGVFWSSIGASPRNRAILGVPEDYDVVGVFGVGYPAEVPPAKPRTPIAGKIKRLP
ncbi:nitroreductase family protein [Cohnella caldifontis]|uniref:nitroreductase family protein n=1 Tax=Cohnella caldifontis TaxID=3027471 RepID=UPI0023EBF501|nr:nitroreductase [Cohnella sp. YIM B05605]